MKFGSIKIHSSYLCTAQAYIMVSKPAMGLFIFLEVEGPSVVVGAGFKSFGSGGFFGEV